jgi:hypothetical protein
MSLTYPHRKKSSGVISGESGGHRIGPSRSTQRQGKCMSRNVQMNCVSYAFVFRKQFYFVLSGLNVIGHGNPDNNLESHCITGITD